VHLKASTGTANEQQRLSEVTVLRNYTVNLSSNSYYIVAGDFNIYRSSEPAFIKLLDQSENGYFIDPLYLTGTFNQSAYAIYHTQSPRVRSFGGGATGGLDDRFDMILISPSIINPGGITYISNSTIAYGNDGFHYNDSINRPPNYAVSQQVADALHYASDHLPVIASFTIEDHLPIELMSFTAKVLYNAIELKWITATEKNSYGFEIERATKNSSNTNNLLQIDWRKIGFVYASGNSNSTKIYTFTDKNIQASSYLYRLKKIDNDGSFNYSNIIEVNFETLPDDFNLFQNYPNPFFINHTSGYSNNSGTTIQYSLGKNSELNEKFFVTLKVFDILGNEVATLMNDYQESGIYKISFNAAGLSSGVYIYKLIASQALGVGHIFIDSKKMIVAK
jgi:hypothetical protein